MAKVKITELNSTASLSTTDVLPVVSILDNTTYKITVKNLSDSLTQVSSSISSSFSTNSATASFVATASWAQNAVTTSFVTLAQTASFVTGSSVRGPLGSNSILSASYSVTASYALNGGGGGGTPGGSTQQIQYNNGGAFGGVSTATFDGTTLRATGSFSGSFTGSLFGSSSYAVSSSYVLSSSFTVSSSFAITSSFAQTASFVVNAQTASYVNPLVQNVSITGSLVVSGANGAGIFSQGATLIDYIDGISNSGSYMAWRAPFSCSVVALYGYYVGGSNIQVNAARSGSSGYGLITGSNLVLTSANTWFSAIAGGLQNGNFNTGDSLQVIMSGSANNQIAVQVDFIRKF